MYARHLYVHVPFCARRCSYCDFSIAVRSQTPVNEYLVALASELAVRFAATGAWELDTLYLGGGTPSRLGADGVARLIDLVRERAALAEGAEVTIEANPDDVTAPIARRWREAGVNRISLGAQSFDDRALAWMHRTHSAQRIGTAAADLRDAGFDNWSLDLIFSLPAEVGRSWERDVEHALELDPAHVSLYGLTIEHGTPLARWRERGAAVEAPEEHYEREFLYADAMLAACGFDHYEVSNFARTGRQSRHNSAYWSGAAYVGVGPAAHGYDGFKRRWNAPHYARWVAALREHRDPLEGQETLSAENRAAEQVYLGLRAANGLVLADHEIAHAEPWIRSGWAFRDVHRLRLTATGWLRLDAIAASLTSLRSC